MSKLILGSLAALAVVAVPVLAQMPHHPRDTMANPVTRADVEAKVKAHFAKMDQNSDGTVTKAEIDGTRALHMKEMRDRHFAQMDANKDGLISRAEFDAGHAARGAMHGDGHKAGRHEGRKAFGHGKMFDRSDANTDGKLSLAETLTKALARFDAADANKDGTLTPEERKAARGQMRGEWRAKRG